MSDLKLEDVLNKFNEYERRLERLEEAMAHRDEVMPSWAKELATKEDLKLFIDMVNKRFEDMNKRFEAVDKRFEDMNKRFEDINKRFEELNTHMRMYFGLLTIVVTLVNAMLTVVLTVLLNK